MDTAYTLGCIALAIILLSSNQCRLYTKSCMGIRLNNIINPCNHDLYDSLLFKEYSNISMDKVFNNLFTSDTIGAAFPNLVTKMVASIILSQCGVRMTEIV